jgi:hypothetical protein
LPRSSERQRLPAGKALVRSVPVTDLVLTELPAEEHLLVAAAGREIQESLLERLDLRSRLVDPLRAFRNRRGLALDGSCNLVEVARLHVAAVPCNPHDELALLPLRRGQVAPVLHDPLDDRAELDERFVRFLRREGPSHLHNYDHPAVRMGQRTRPALDIYLWSRAAIWIAAIFAFFFFEPNRNPEADRWDTARLHELGYVTDIWARWDSDFFLRIAQDGYDEASAAFHPLYPALVAGLGRVLVGHYVLAGVIVSLLAALGAFALLYRLADERLGVEGARRTVLYLAVFPMALFLQAVYSESLFLLLALSAFALAERDRFAAAGIVTGLAILTRAAGLALLPALALLAWRSREQTRALGGLALSVPVAAVYPLLLWQQVDDPWAFAHAQDRWHRHVSPAGPFGGIWDGLVAGWRGLEQFVVGHGTHVAGANPMHAAAENLQALGFLALFLSLTVVAWKRFGAPYGLFAAVSLAIPLSDPSSRWPLLSLPRFGLVIFPFFLALAALTAERPRLHNAVVGCSALFLGVAVVQWALWQWVA